LQAAAVCFARSGFHGASMSEISKEAGMSAGHIYNYFDSKEAIIMAFVDLESEHVAAQLRELGSKDDPLQSMIDDAPRHIDENLDPHFFQLPMEMFAEAARNPKIAEAMRAADVAAMASSAHHQARARAARPAGGRCAARWPHQHHGVAVPWLADPRPASPEHGPQLPVEGYRSP
jgi:AcrR family transcriptional regulator